MRVVIIAYPEGNVKGDWENTEKRRGLREFMRKLKFMMKI